MTGQNDEHMTRRSKNEDIVKHRPVNNQKTDWHKASNCQTKSSQEIDEFLEVMKIGPVNEGAHPLTHSSHVETKEPDKKKINTQITKRET